MKISVGKFVITVFVTVLAILLVVLGIALIIEFAFWLDDRITFGPSKRGKNKNRRS